MSPSDEAAPAENGAAPNAIDAADDSAATNPDHELADQPGESQDLGGQTPGVADSFAELGLSQDMLATLASIGYEKPSPVQAGVIPIALTGRDVLGQARTGTGKTASFAIPIIETLLEHEGKERSPQALALVPTRELAVQVAGEFERLAAKKRCRCVALYGGKPIKSQISKLERGIDVVIGTPGRVIDHLSRGTLDLRGLRIVVLDEADRMLDIGFRPDIEKILRRCPASRQTLLLSATVAPGVKRLAERYMHEPQTLDFSPKSKSVDTIEQHYFTVDGNRKFDLLCKLIDREEPEQTIVFCRTKRGTDKVQERLRKKGYLGVDCIHGDMAQGARDRVMKQFRAGEVRLLVATDVVGRGIDVTGISHIINYDIPQSSDDYVHRVGRTGRMGREGVAFTFVTREEGDELTRIEMLINKVLLKDAIEGFEAVDPSKAQRSAPAQVRYYGIAAEQTDEQDPSAPSESAGDTVPPEPPAPPKPKPFGGRTKRRRRAL
ncbi:DEAD/DEAH box helicase [Botrimarina hoheduenensis]|uniref:DEAD-box ATP-dependent RNA helicase CshA n=1 Tax=Botrimarina hoheduenensis TaxID=2528000 RepID=A0A5C5W630_9BACT|nr:DEAD/DEAH box helicase [Botrimarina hoheduenensis]TWT46428.1 DEAD-box ATP-dependent RNA helicase CshA [Botrimarina hoheduenensis]